MTDSRSTYGVVERQMGIGIYICAVPARDFDTVCVFKTKKDFNSYPGPSIPQYVEGIQKPVDALANQAVRKAKKKKTKKEINAIISRDGKTAVAVHFKTEITPAMANKAIVDNYKGYCLFIQNKPAKKYKVISTVKLNNKLNLDEAGISSLSNMLDSLIQKYEKNTGIEKADGLITTSCIEAEFIKLVD
jgi:uncharacterized membrane-anchored protein YjiN (DUF445 family)